MPGLVPGIHILATRKDVDGRDKPGHDGGRIDTMHVLAIDTALEACAAAVVDTASGKVVTESLPMVRGHAEAVMPLIRRVMDKAATGFSDLDRIAVTTGPGSFTGLRVGISAARGIALAAGKPAFGLTTLAAFAAPLIAEDDKTSIAVAIDARHAHVYLHVFGPAGRTLVAPRIASVAEAVRAAANGPVRLVGTGAAMLAMAWPASEARPIQVEDMRAPDITWVARLAIAASGTPAPPKPLYLRAPDAQPQDAARLARR
jgi:tRNA threonylcarbamoyl adenosine modification protein YeaZ